MLSSTTRQQLEALSQMFHLSPFISYLFVCSAGIEPRASPMPGERALGLCMCPQPTSISYLNTNLSSSPSCPLLFHAFSPFSLLCGISSTPIPFPKGSYLKLFLAVFSTVPLSLFWVAKSLGTSWQKVRATGSVRGEGHKIPFGSSWVELKQGSLE